MTTNVRAAVQEVQSRSGSGDTSRWLNAVDARRPSTYFVEMFHTLTYEKEAVVISDPATPEAVVLQPGEGRSIDLGSFHMTLKATGGETAGAFSLLEAEEPPDFGPPMHIHRDAAEAFYVLSGEYIMFLEDREVVCPAGSFIFIPVGMRHGFRVGKTASRKLNFYFPAAMVGYFEDLSDAIKKDEVDATRLSEIALRHSMEVLGPVPESYI